MITQQRELQGQLGYDFTRMSDRERVDYVTMMVLAAIKELGEALDEVSWKPWAAGTTRFMALPFMGELNDAWQFICNMWLVAIPNATPDQVATAMITSLEAKLAVNRVRVEEGYDGHSARWKCPRCGRALDDANIGFVAPELVCDGTVEGCKMPDLA
jgi:hypothetical protein